MKRRWTAILLILCMAVTMLPPTTAQAAEGTDTKYDEIADFMTHEELLQGYTDYWSGMHSIIYFGSNGAQWQIIGKNEQMSEELKGDIITVSSWTKVNIPFNTADHVASLTKDSWTEYGCEFISSERRAELVESVKDVVYDNRYPSQMAPPKEAWGTSYVRQELQNMYNTMFSSTEKSRIKPVTLYTDISRVDDGYWDPGDWDWGEPEGSYGVRYTEVYKTEDHLYLPYISQTDSGTLYIGENTADKLASGESVSISSTAHAIPSMVDVTRGIGTTEVVYVGNQNDEDEFDESQIQEGTPYSKSSGLFKVSNGSSSADHDPYTNTGMMRPFMNLDITDISFASWVPPVTSEGEVDNSTYKSRSVYMRRDDQGLLGTATISSDMSSVTIENLSSSAARLGDVYLVVQYRGKGASDNYIEDKAYAKEVKSDGVITASELTDGAIVDFANTEVWLEWDDNNGSVLATRAKISGVTGGGGDPGETTPFITDQPENAIVTESNTAKFSVTATGENLSYQWQSKTDDTDWTNISGATSAEYTIEATTPDMNGTQYRCVVTNNGGSVNSEEVTLTVNPETYLITVENDGNGTASASSSSAAAGTEITLTAQPAEGYVFDHWEVTPDSVTITDNKFEMPASDVTVKAIFSKKIETHKITLTASPAEGGIVSGAQEAVEEGEKITVEATANEGYHFVNWTEGDKEVSKDVNFTFEVTANRNLVANFAQNTYDVNVTAGEGGTASGAQKDVTHGSEITITATPDEGYHFVNWTENGNEVSKEATYTFEVTADHNLVANFAQNTYDVNVTAGEGGTASGGQQDVTYGTEITVTASPNAGYHFVNWTENGNEISKESTYTFEVTADHNLVANFAQNTYDVNVMSGNGGVASGGQQAVEYGTEITVTATPNAGYHFVNWTENGQEVSTHASYTFAVTAERNLTANFAADPVEPEPTPTPDPDPTPTPDPEPEGPATEDSEGWTAIEDEVAAADDGDEIVVDMNGTTEVPKEIFEAVAGKDVDVTFELGDGVSWTVNGTDIPTDADLNDLDLGVTMDSDGIPVNVINTITGERDTVQMTLAHDGEFGFTMTLSAPLGKENAGYWANLYHYDEDAKAMTFETAALIDDDGNAKLPMSHASQYAIVIDDHSHAAEEPSALPFTDVHENDWFYDVVRYVYEQGLMTGTSVTEFSPNLTTTRGMIVSILNRLEDGPTAEAAGFTDVAAGDWYADAVNWAASEGIVAGYEDQTFRPNDPITREQLAAMLMNYAAWKGEDVSARADLSSYNDAASVSSWAVETVQWAVAEGLISGMPGNLLEPQGSATRAQVAAILQRFLGE